MSEIELTILGTSSMIPTKQRNPTSVYLKYNDTSILLDCAEGTQRQIKYAGLKSNRIKIILITHWHGDHVLGLPGLLQTLGNSNFKGKIKLYGPKGSEEYFKNMLKGFAFDTPIDIEVIDLIKDGIFFENDKFLIEMRKMQHGIPCNAYSFIEKNYWKIDKTKLSKYNLTGEFVGMLQRGMAVKLNDKNITPELVSKEVNGKKITFVTDTENNSNIIPLAKNSDLFICESTYLDELKHKAEEYNHMTAKEAATLAKEADVKQLILTHFSGRYRKATDLEDEAKAIFPKTKAAEDFMKIKL